MKKSLRKLIPAFVMMVVTMALLGTSTFAWFSMNNKVTVSGMSVNTKVGSNLMIKKDTLASTAKIADTDFVTSESGEILAQLEPVSTRNGKNFFYTLDAKANGDANADTYTAYNAVEVPTSEELTSFNNDYSTTGAVGYVDYIFQLKAVNAADAGKDIKITKLDLIYNGAQDVSKAFRVAVFVEDITSANPAGGSGTLKGIYAPSDAANHTANSAVGATSGAPAAIETTAYNTVANIATVGATATGYYKVVIRLYLEGEDTTCKNDTYALLTGRWALDLELKIDTSTDTNTAVSNISKYTSATVSATTWYYDGTYVWNNKANIGTETDRTAISSASSDVQTAFGYVAP